MRKIINQYLFKEVAQAWLGVTLILLAILVTNQFAKILGDASSGNLSGNVIAELLLYSSIEYLTILLPLSSFLAILLVFGRLYKDSEMAAIMASGVGPLSLYRPLILPTLLLAFILGLVSSYLAPDARKNMDFSRQNALLNLGIDFLEPGRFVTLNNGSVMYSEDRLENDQLINVFVQQEIRNNVNVIVSETAEILGTQNSGNLLVFYNGYRYEGKPGDLDFRILEFSEHQLPLSINTNQSKKIDLSSEQLSSLIQKNSLEAMAEVQWRISPAIALIILVFLAIPLSKSSPRDSRYTGLILGILIYMIYANCLGAARVWFEQGVTPEIYGLWWVHVIALLLGIFMLLINYRFFQRILPWRK